MTEKNQWADKDHKWQIIEERRFMWSPEQIQRLAEAMNLTSGITIVDVGCGLGYLGWTYWKHFGEDGAYLGVDCSISLLEEATEMAGDWSTGGAVDFINGDSYSIPITDGSIDVTMCQTLLMHLEFPEEALREMVRITKPGGIVMCKENNLVSHFMKLSYSSCTDGEDIDDMLFYRRMNLIWVRGRKKLGFGDLGIASRVPRMMHETGLKEIRGFCNERLQFLLPPYEYPQQKQRVDIIQKHYPRDSTAEEKQEAKEDYRKYHLAGGGDSSSFDQDYDRFLEIVRARSEKRLNQIKDETLFACSGGSNFLCIFGKKPF